jgi:iron complex outermembrane receptor protein
MAQPVITQEDLWFDLVLFHSDYSELRTGDAGGMIGNGMYGRGRGAELAVRWKASEPLRIDAAYTFLDFDLALEPGRGTNFLRLRTEGLAPRHQASLRAALDLPRDARLDATLRHVGRLSGLGVPSYTEFDLALSYRLGRALELSLVGRNLLHDHHPEQGFASSATGLSSEVRRSALARLTWTP